MKFEWTHQAIDELLDLYESHRCLYDTKSEDYKNRDLRNRSSEEIAQTLGCTVAVVKNKIHTLRSQYTREKIKVSKKSKSGTGAGIGSAWYLFERMRFLDDHMAPKSSSSNLKVDVSDADDTTSEKSNQESAEVDLEAEGQMSDDAQSITEVQTQVSTKRPTKLRDSAASKRAKKEEQEASVLNSATQCMTVLANRMSGKSRQSDQEIKEDDDYDILGKLFAREVRTLPNPEAKFRIHQVLFEAAAQHALTAAEHGCISWGSQPAYPSWQSGYAGTTPFRMPAHVGGRANTITSNRATNYLYSNLPSNLCYNTNPNSGAHNAFYSSTKSPDYQDANPRYSTALIPTSSTANNVMYSTKYNSQTASSPNLLTNNSPFYSTGDGNVVGSED